MVSFTESYDEAPMADATEDAAICDLLERLMRLLSARANKAIDATPAIALTLDDTTLTMDQGTTLAGVATVVTTNFLGPLTFQFNGLPTGVTASVGDPSFVNSTTRTYPITYVCASDASVVSNDAFDVVASGSGVTDTESATVTTVLVSPEAIDISVSDTSFQVTQGGTISFDVPLTRLFGYVGTVTLAVTDLPSGVSASFPSGNTYSGATATLPVTLTATGGATEVSADAAVVSATGSGVTQVDVNITVTVVASGGGYVAYRADDFSTYANTAALQTAVGTTGTIYTTDDINSSMIALDSSVLFKGHNTMRYDFPPSSSATPQVKARTGNLQQAWARVVMQYSQGFTTIGDGTGVGGSAAYKLMFFTWSGQNGRSGIEFTNTDDYLSYAGVDFGGGIGGGGFGTPLYRKTPYAEWTDGAWYEYVLLHSLENASTGRFRYWLRKVDSDGAPLTSFTLMQDAQGPTDDGRNWPNTGTLMIGRNYNRPRSSTQNFKIWWGEWEIVDALTYTDPFGVSP